MRKALSIMAVLLIGGLILGLAPNATPYHLTGDYFETCSCDPACPCIFHSDATQGFCKATVVWHIRSGRYNDIPLQGLNVVLIISSAGNMEKNVGQMKGMLYLDHNANPEQKKALDTIFRTQFGGFFGVLPDAKVVSITFTREADNFRVQIPDILDAAIEPLPGMPGKTTQIHHQPFGALADPVSVARSKHHRYSDPDLDSWEFPAGRNGFFAEFKYGSVAE